MKTPPNASVQKVCRTKGSGSSLRTDNGSKLGAPLPSSDWVRSQEPRGCPNRRQRGASQKEGSRALLAPFTALCHPEPATHSQP